MNCDTKQHISIFTLLFLIFCLLFLTFLPAAIPVKAATTKITIQSSKKVVYYNKKITLKAKVSGSGNKHVVWKSSNRNIATVNQNGVVTGTGVGLVSISATCNGKTAKTTITAVRYSIQEKAKKVIVCQYNTRRTYRIYSERYYNGLYGKNRGCNVTAAAIVLSGMVSSSITPQTVHLGTSKYSEAYAIRKLSGNYSAYDTIKASSRLAKLNSSSPTLLMLNQILRNSGLTTKYVRKITNSSASEMYKHLAKGNPIIFSTSSAKSYNGVKLARTWHTLVLLGLDAKGRPIIADPYGGYINYAPFSYQNYHFTVSELTRYFQRSCKTSTKLYSGDRYGYILISR